MESKSKSSRLKVMLLASRPQFLTASAAPVLVGSALGYAAAGSFSVVLFVLAVLAIVALQAGANIVNDYFDHLSKNDWLNQNPTPFSGGSRYIQNGILSAKTMLLVAFAFLAVGSSLGLIIVLLTKSVFILIIGLVGLLGSFFYTAPPIKFGYRSIGEPVIGILFGLLPVYGAYYLQTGTVDAVVLLPATIVAILIFLVIFVNEFPDLAADTAVNKKTLIVCFGTAVSVWIYRVALIASFVIAAAAIFINSIMFFAGLFYLFMSPVGIIAIRFANQKNLTTQGEYNANRITILLHLAGSLALSAGFLVSGLSS